MNHFRRRIPKQTNTNVLYLLIVQVNTYNPKDMRKTIEH